MANPACQVELNDLMRWRDESLQAFFRQCDNHVLVEHVQGAEKESSCYDAITRWTECVGSREKSKKSKKSSCYDDPRTCTGCVQWKRCIARISSGHVLGHPKVAKLLPNK